MTTPAPKQTDAPTAPTPAPAPANVPALTSGTGENFFSQLLAPVSRDDAWKLCQSIAASDLCPKAYRGKPFEVAIAASLGRRLGLDPITSLQGIAVVNGNPKLWGDVMWGIVFAQRDFDGCDEECEESGNGDWRWTVTLTRRGRKPVCRTFSRADAVKANLVGKDIWRLYEKRMGQWRARTLAARDTWPEVLAGMVADADEGADAKPVEGTVRSTSRFSEDVAPTKEGQP
jgi:hypothetical protein